MYVPKYLWKYAKLIYIGKIKYMLKKNGPLELHTIMLTG